MVRLSVVRTCTTSSGRRASQEVVAKGYWRSEGICLRKECYSIDDKPDVTADDQMSKGGQAEPESNSCFARDGDAVIDQVQYDYQGRGID